MDQWQSGRNSSDFQHGTEARFQFPFPQFPIQNPDQDVLNELLKKIEREMFEAKLVSSGCEIFFKERLVLNLRKNLSDNIDSLNFSNERKSYLLHQLANVHALEELFDLFHEINLLQKELERDELDFLSLEVTATGVKWTKHTLKTQPKAICAIIGFQENLALKKILSEQIGKIILIHHTPIDCSTRYQDHAKKMIDEIFKSSTNSRITRVVKKLWHNQDILEFLNLPEILEIFEATTNLTKVESADIILLGTSSFRNFLNEHSFKKDAVIVDSAYYSGDAGIFKLLLDKRPDLNFQHI